MSAARFLPFLFLVCIVVAPAIARQRAQSPGCGY